MWQNDLVGLDLWLKYYRQQFDDVLILCFSTNPKYYLALEERKVKYEVLEGEGWDEPGRTNEMLKVKQQQLLEKYDWVLFCNLDEFLIPDPKRFKNMKQLIESRYYIPAECYEVIQIKGDKEIDYSRSFLAQRQHWIKNENMNKVLLSSVPLSWNEGQHQIKEVNSETSKNLTNTGLYLIHLKHADTKTDGRDLGPMKRQPEAYVYEQIKNGKEEPIPDSFKEIL
jgi:hypothetical protein